jgi:hypothetical protein
VTPPYVSPEKRAYCESLGERMASVCKEEVADGNLTGEEIVGVLLSVAINSFIDQSTDLDILETLIQVVRACRAVKAGTTSEEVAACDPSTDN